jgi:hypothetical protein
MSIYAFKPGAYQSRPKVCNFGKNAFPLKGGVCGCLYPQAFDLKLFLYFDRKGKDQTTDNHHSPLAAPAASRIASQTRRAGNSLNLNLFPRQKL